MIPVTLTLKNFLSYGENVPPLDFNQFHVACLSGNNGQGKSALLDALTWVIWGEGRKPSQEKKADQSLLRIGQKHMQVELVFDLEGDRFRIIRNFSLAGKSSRSGLEFQVFNPQENKYISLTGPSIKKTQEKIIQTLRIDYSTFINSAFILQGRIDEFSRKSARERKEILAEILGLSRYDELANLAKLHQRKLSELILARESRIKYINQEIGNIDFYQQKIKEKSESYQRISREIEKKEKELKEISEKINLLRHKEEQRKDLEERIIQQNEELNKEKNRIELKEKELKECTQIITRKDIIIRNFENFQTLTQESNRLTRKLQEIRKIDEEKISLEKYIEKERNNLIISLRNRQDRYKDLQDKANQLEKRKSLLSDLERTIQLMQELQQESEEIRKEGNNLNLQVNTLQGKISRYEKDIQDNQEKLRLLREKTEGECPLCASKLDQEKRNKIENNLIQEISLCRSNIENLKREEKRLLVQKENLRNKWEELNQKLKEKDLWQQRYSRAYLEYQESQQATQLLIEIQNEIRRTEIILQKKEYAQTEQEKLKMLDQKIKAIGYNLKKHNEITQKLERLENSPIEKARLEEAMNKIENLKHTISELKENFWKKEGEIESLKLKMEKLKEELIGLSSLQDKIKQGEQLLKSILSQKENILEERGAYQSKFDQCLELKKEEKEIIQELKKMKKEVDIYEKLVVAFGKNGIQALIIENTLPEIEEEANNLLSKLTHNGTQITIESMRDLKSGGFKETLDLKINDELGIRDYELYSGGEAFRIDFALRIALSKLLTRRAGTRLRTLVIDEGFGTQDEEGIDNLIQAIQSISEDFDKILVITHLETLKNAFPVRVEVTKHPEIGSRFEIIRN
ncbi:MAG: SMC family ATPase [Candidatus Caldatribacteriota bacterium]